MLILNLSLLNKKKTLEANWNTNGLNIKLSLTNQLEAKALNKDIKTVGRYGQRLGVGGLIWRFSWTEKVETILVSLK